MSPEEGGDRDEGILQPVGRAPSGAPRRIAVCLDGSPASEGCLPVALGLARSYASELDVLHVLESAPSPRAALPADAADWLIARAEAEQYLADVAARTDERGLRGRAHVLEGHVAEQILCFADREGVDLIVLSSHGEKGVTEWDLGSTAEKVLARARASVLLVPNPGLAGSEDSPPAQRVGEASLGRILVLLDGSRRAESVLSPLRRLALERDAVLVLLHVTALPQLFESDTPSAEDDALRRRLAAYNERGARRYLARIRARLAREGCKVETVLDTGDLRALLPGVVTRERVDLVAMTSHGRTGDRCRSCGDAAQYLLRHARVPVFMLQVLPQHASDFARTVRHRRGAAPLRGSRASEFP